MLALQHRLTKKKDFEKIFKQGRAYYTKLLGIKILFNQTELSRFAVVVSAKVSKSSVKRNRLKRQIRQALRELSWEIISGFDLIIMALPGLLGKDYLVIKGELEKIFIKLKLFR